MYVLVTDSNGNGSVYSNMGVYGSSVEAEHAAVKLIKMGSVATFMVMRHIETIRPKPVEPDVEIVKIGA